MLYEEYLGLMPTTRAALYLRVSLDATGERLAVDRQREDCLAIVAARGWEVVGEFVDNSISASDSRKQRPGYDALCRAYDEGGFDALLCWDVDRLTRQPRQLEDWIERAEHGDLKLVTANGEADLSTDGGRLFVRMKAAVARSEVERKSARQIRAQRQRAELGKPASGVRPMGYAIDGEIVEAEAAVVRDVFTRFLAGQSIKGIARGLETAGAATRLGGRWTPSTLTSMLRNGRYAGRSVYKGVDVGRGTWTPIVSDSEFAAVQARLDDPRRKTRRFGTARKYLGAGLYRCGACGQAVGSLASNRLANGEARFNYVCRDSCFHRSGRPVDDYVLRQVRAVLAREDLRDLLVRPADQAQMAQLTARRNDLQARISRKNADYDADLIDGTRHRSAVDQAEAELDLVGREEAKLLSATPDPILTADDPLAKFDAEKSVERRRAVIDFLVTVTLKPVPRGSHHFNEASVDVVERLG